MTRQPNWVSDRRGSAAEAVRAWLGNDAWLVPRPVILVLQSKRLGQDTLYVGAQDPPAGAIGARTARSRPQKVASRHDDDLSALRRPVAWCLFKGIG